MFGENVFGDGLEKTVFVSEQTVDRRRLHVGILGNPSCGHRGGAVIAHQSGRDRDDPRPDVVACGGRIGHVPTITEF